MACLYEEPLGTENHSHFPRREQSAAASVPVWWDNSQLKTREKQRQAPGLDGVRSLQEPSFPAQPGQELAFLFLKRKTDACNRCLLSESLVAGTSNCWDAEVVPRAGALEKPVCPTGRTLRQ